MSGVGPPQRTFAPAPRSRTVSSAASSPGQISRKTRASTPSVVGARSSRASTTSTCADSDGSSSTSTITPRGGSKSSGSSTRREAGTRKRLRIHACGVPRAQRSTSIAASIGRLAGGNSAAWSISFDSSAWRAPVISRVATP